MFGPIHWRSDGTAVFATPLGKGHIPLIALTDLGFFARYSFDNRELVSGKDLEVASEMVGRDHLVETFKRVTGKNAVFVDQTLDEWFMNVDDPDRPLAREQNDTTTWRENFS